MSLDTLQKMSTENKEVVHYTLHIHGEQYDMNALIGKKIKIEWSGEVICMCGKKMESFYLDSGFCYRCYNESPQASPSIFKPELCTAHLGKEERDLEWEKNFQLAPHYVYLANSSGIKVGITRATQGITRWMDQGAAQAIILAEVPNRRFSGDIEVALKQVITDVTNWRAMLSGVPEMLDMVKEKDRLSAYVPTTLQQYIMPNNTVVDICYPVKEYPTKIYSLKLNRQKIVEGELKGIKGQYLILDNGKVFNVRSHQGYICQFSFESVQQTTLF